MTVLKAISAGQPATFNRSYPQSDEVVTIATAMSVSDAEAIAEKAGAAFQTWSKTSPTMRREMFNELAVKLVEMQDEFISCIIAETGTSNEWAKFNIKGSVALLKEAGALAKNVHGQTIPLDDQGTLAMTFRRAAGVCLGIAPWNAPLLLGLRAIAAPIALGNTGILKASELCPGTHWMISRLFETVNAPEGVFNIVTSTAEDTPQIIESLIRHPAVARVNFTGSTRVGRIIGRLSGENLKPCLLELGGKAPLVVLEDADVDAAATAAVYGAFMNAGQICMSTERIVVDEGIADAFVDALAAKAKEIGDLGGLISATSAERLKDIVLDAEARGAKVRLPLDVNGAAMRPVVIDHVKKGMRIYAEESFGPIASVVRVNGPQEAIEVANDTEYGLAAAVFGGNVEKVISVAREINCGICHINGPTVKSDPLIPFGGVKASGYGRFGGHAAIGEFTELRSLTLKIE